MERVMKKQTLFWMMVTAVVALTMAILSAPALADDLTGATALLCSSSWANVCTADEVCESGPPWGWNIPQFIEMDLEEKILSTTEPGSLGGEL
jgi:hypothetical protein